MMLRRIRSCAAMRRPSFRRGAGILHAEKQLTQRNKNDTV
jgi:hypothetical protein